MKSLSFGQKLLFTVGVLLILVMGVYAIIGDYRLTETTDTYIDALIDNTVAQSTSSIADWLNTRLSMTEGVAKALEVAEDDEDAKAILQSATQGGGFKDVYVGRDDGYMLMPTDASAATLPDDFDPRSRPWYKLAKSLNRASFTEPYLDAGSDETIISTLAPVKRGMYQGVVGGDISLSSIDQILATVSLGGTGYAALVGQDGKVLYHPNRELVGKPIDALVGQRPDLTGADNMLNIEGDIWRVSFHAIENARGVDWYLATFANEGLINGPVVKARATGAIVAVVALIITLLALHFMIRVLMTPVRGLKVAMADIASGDADLTRRLDDQSNDEFGELARSFNSFVENIQTVVWDVQRGASELGGNVVSLRMTSSASRSSVQSQQSEIDMIATAINEMSAAASEIAQSAQQTADAANTADEESRQSLDTVKDSRDAVKRLSGEITAATAVIDKLGSDVTSITGVLEVIKSIADQTNLLALNAAIEAARAGDAGRGFAVVADEVRNLARRTQDSTEEINTMIALLQKGAGDAVQVMQASTAVSNVSMEKAQDAMEALDRIATAIKSISEMTTQIATASEEQTSVSEELNSSITRIADQGQEAAAAASENDVYSGQIESVGKALTQNVERFKV